MDSRTVLDFWFHEIDEKKWFAKDEGFDQKIKERFGDTWQKAVQGECFIWRTDIRGRLAEIIVLDQFSRNIFRDDPRSFANDQMALVLTQEALVKPELKELSTSERAFLYMPLMHSESLVIHQEALKRFAEPGLENNLKFEKKHLAILERFGRYPHRNKILGRKSTPAELAFLQEPNSSF